MPPGISSPPQESSTAERIARLEARVVRLEEYIASLPAGGTSPERTQPAPEQDEVIAAQASADLELQVGQTWFARIGILALAAGGGFMLTLPYPQLPAVVPSFAGWAVAIALLLMSRVSAPWLALVATCVRGAGMALLFCATLRLMFFGTRHALPPESWFGRALLVAAVAANVLLAVRCRSQGLTGLALAMACVAAVVTGSSYFALTIVLLVALTSVSVGTRYRWATVLLAGMVMAFGTYLAWALLATRGGAGQLLAREPSVAPAFLLLCSLAFGTAPLLQHSDESARPIANICALVNCVLGYGLFLLHTATAFQAVFAPANAAASALFLGLAVAYRNRHHSHASTFFYAMTGYGALSVAIMKMSAMPEVFVWLSLQSVLVVATAIWFGSRFIVVANFVIYAAIVAAYVMVKQRETGISFGFGVVALVSARLLNWQQHRLELKTDLMRNAYLLSAFFVFPYALYHLVPSRHLALSWVGLALGYYTLNLFVRSPKYRWMGHATLALTTVYVVIVASSRLDPVYRVLSFLALGTALLIVSFSFTRAQRRQRQAATPEGPGASPAA